MSVYIDPKDRIKIVTKWVDRTMWFLHGWVCICIFGLFENPPEAVANALLAIIQTCTFGIGAGLVILLFDRAADALINRFSTPNAPSETVKTVVETTTITDPTKSVSSSSEVKNV